MQGLAETWIHNIISENIKKNIHKLKCLCNSRSETTILTPIGIEGGESLQLKVRIQMLGSKFQVCCDYNMQWFFTCIRQLRICILILHQTHLRADLQIYNQHIYCVLLQTFFLLHISISGLCFFQYICKLFYLLPNKRGDGKKWGDRLVSIMHIFQGSSHMTDLIATGTDSVHVNNCRHFRGTFCLHLHGPCSK